MDEKQQRREHALEWIAAGTRGLLYFCRRRLLQL